MSFTGIGRIGSQHTLTSPQDNTLYLFNHDMWCTHPLLGDEFMSSGTFDITAGSNIVTGTGTLFTLLCGNMEITNVPTNKYIVYENANSTFGILEVDYVLDDTTLILKTPAFEADASVGKVSLIDYWNTPILKEVEVRNPADAGVVAATIVYANKYSSSPNSVWDVPLRFDNEGGLEPMLISNNGLVILKY